MQHTCISLYNKRPRLFPKLIRLLVTLQSSKQNKPLPYYFIKKKTQPNNFQTKFALPLDSSDFSTKTFVTQATQVLNQGMI